MSTITGIDPGLVHTGIVRLRIDRERKQWSVASYLVAMQLDADGKPDVERAAQETAHWVGLEHNDLVVIEAYKPRSHFDTDANMGRLVNETKRLIRGSKTLVNTGVKQVVRPPLMRQLGMWNFPTPSHHQDLRSAARIGLYGAFKEDALNAELYDLTVGLVDATGWHQV